MTVAPVSSEETEAFHMTQLVLEYQNIRSPGRMSRCSDSAGRMETTVPPWLWTIPLGVPVVPEEKSTHSGWSKGRGAKTGSV